MDVVDTKEFAGYLNMKNLKDFPRPFLKWAGSKKQLLTPIKEKIKFALDKYHYNVLVDGFLGSGAVTFLMINEFGDRVEEILANDCNADLVNCFKVVKKNIKELISRLKLLEAEFRNTKFGEEFYKRVRAEFNDRITCQASVDRAANFIFLNHTCFNGLYRVNSKGEFNVPYGKNQNAKIFDEDLLVLDSEAFKCVNFKNEDFEMDKVAPGWPSGVLFYFDPPYRPISKTASFSKYTKRDFGESEQLRLAQYCCWLCDKGAGVIASNSDTSDNFYKDNYKGFELERVLTMRMMSADISRRGRVSEVLLSRFR